MALDTSNPKFKKAALVIFLFLGAGYFYHSQHYGPRNESIEKIEEELRKLKQDLKTTQAFVGTNDTLFLIEELDKRMLQLRMVEDLLPEKENLPLLLESITSIGTNMGLKFALFEPMTPIQHELFQERPIAVILRGGYHQTARFLSYVADLPQIVKPVSLSLVRDSRRESGPSETLTAEITLSTYLMIEMKKEEKEASGDKTKGKR